MDELLILLKENTETLVHLILNLRGRIVLTSKFASLQREQPHFLTPFIHYYTLIRDVSSNIATKLQYSQRITRCVQSHQVAEDASELLGNLKLPGRREFHVMSTHEQIQRSVLHELFHHDD